MRPIGFGTCKTDGGERLTESGHPFGWLLRVLQEEDADERVFREVLETAVSEIGRSEETPNAQLWEALNYLILLVFHERSETEREPLSKHRVQMKWR